MKKGLKLSKYEGGCKGFQSQLIYKFIRKFNYKKTLKKPRLFESTLQFPPSMTKGLSKIFKGLRIVYSSGTSFRRLIGNSKNKI